MPVIFQGVAFAQPQPRRRTSGLGIILGGVIVGLAVIVGVSVWGHFQLYGKPPTLTAAQFDTLFAEGDSFMGRSISLREVGTADASGSVGSCQEAINKIVATATSRIAARTSDESLILRAGRFDEPALAEEVFEPVSTKCATIGAGFVNKAQWFGTTIPTTDVWFRSVVMLHGNVALVAFCDQEESTDVREMAGALQAEAAKAVKR